MPPEAPALEVTDLGLPEFFQHQQLVFQFGDPRFQPLDLLVLPLIVGPGAAGGALQHIQPIVKIPLPKRIQIPGKSHTAPSFCPIIAQKKRLEQTCFQRKRAVSLY